MWEIIHSFQRIPVPDFPQQRNILHWIRKLVKPFLWSAFPKVRSEMEGFDWLSWKLIISFSVLRTTLYRVIHWWSMRVKSKMDNSGTKWKEKILKCPFNLRRTVHFHGIVNLWTALIINEWLTKVKIDRWLDLGHIWPDKNPETWPFSTRMNWAFEKSEWSRVQRSRIILESSLSWPSKWYSIIIVWPNDNRWSSLIGVLFKMVEHNRDRSLMTHACPDYVI